MNLNFFNMIETSSYIKQPAVIFGHVLKMFGNVRISFGQSSENFQKPSKISGKCSEIAKISLILLFTFNKEKIARPLVHTYPRAGM